MSDVVEIGRTRSARARGASAAPDPVPTLDVELGLGRLVIGIDEVGRGAIAGPVAVGAVAIDPAAVSPLAGVRDSKLLTEARREAIHDALMAWGSARAVGLASAREVDELGIIAALGLAGRRALDALLERGVDALASTVLLDGIHDWLSPALPRAPRVVTVAKADRDCASVASASVIAKVHRDRLMVTADGDHPVYGWRSNKGYGSTAHYEAIREHGASPLHRVSWLRAPLD